MKSWGILSVYTKKPALIVRTHISKMYLLKNSNACVTGPENATLPSAIRIILQKMHGEFYNLIKSNKKCNHIHILKQSPILQFGVF